MAEEGRVGAGTGSGWKKVKEEDEREETKKENKKKVTTRKVKMDYEDKD